MIPTNKFRINKKIAFVCPTPELFWEINEWFKINGYRGLSGNYWTEIAPIDNSLCFSEHSSPIYTNVGYCTESWFITNNYIMIYPKYLEDVKAAIQLYFNSLIGDQDRFIFSNDELYDLA